MNALSSGQAVENLRERQPCEAECRIQFGELESQIHGLLGAFEGSAMRNTMHPTVSAGIELWALSLQIGHLRHSTMEHPEVARLFGCCCHGGYFARTRSSSVQSPRGFAQRCVIRPIIGPPFEVIGRQGAALNRPNGRAELAVAWSLMRRIRDRSSPCANEPLPRAGAWLGARARYGMV